MKPIVDPDLYDQDYYLKSNVGRDEFLAGLETSPIHPKYQSVLNYCRFSPEKTVLDIGCGRGELVYYAARGGCGKTVGIDYSRSAIELANTFKNRLPEGLKSRMHFYHTDVKDWAESEPFDYIFLVETWEHMHDYQIKPLLGKAAKLLKKDGLLILTTPNGLYERYLYPAKRLTNIPLNLFKFPLRILRGKWKPRSFRELVQNIFKVYPLDDVFLDQTHVNVSSPGKIKRMLKENGLAGRVICSDSSKNLLSLMFSKWAGREMIVIASKK